MSSIRKETQYLYIAQLSNMLLPLLSIPYLTSILGSEYFGKLAYSQVVSMISIFFVDFGFNFSAAKEVGSNQQNKENLNALYINVQVVKIFIFSIVLLIGLIGFFYFPQSDTDNELLLIGVFSSVSSITTSGWLLQGLGKNSLLAFSNLVTRLCSVLLIFLLIKSKEDIFIAAFLQLFPPVISGFIVIFFLFKNNVINLKFGLFSFSSSMSSVRESFHNFSASLITLGFTYFNPLIIKYFLGDSALGVYSLADKLVNILRQLYSPLVQSNFSYICKLFGESKLSEIRSRLLKVALFFVCISVVALTANYFLGFFVLHNFLAKGYGYHDVILVCNLIFIMIFTQLIISISMILVNLVMIPSGNSYFLKRIYFLALIFYLAIIYPMSNYFGLYGISTSITIVELSIILMFFIFVKSKKVI